MSILCDDPAEQALSPLGSIYEISCKTKAGGYCENSAKAHLSELLVCPGLEYESYKAMIRKRILVYAKPYAKNWLHDARKIKVVFKPNIFEPRKRYINLVFDGNLIAVYTIRDKYEFEKHGYSF